MMPPRTQTVSQSRTMMRVVLPQSQSLSLIGNQSSARAADKKSRYHKFLPTDSHSSQSEGCTGNSAIVACFQGCILLTSALASRTRLHLQSASRSVNNVQSDK